MVIKCTLQSVMPCLLELVTTSLKGTQELTEQIGVLGMGDTLDLDTCFIISLSIACPRHS
jgi:hypothetical protein